MDIYDIAAKSGYSIATVSRVINNSDNVSDKAREKILSVINEHDYAPNRLARSLAKNESSLIGVMVADIRRHFESRAAFELEKNLHSEGYMTLYGGGSSNPTEKKRYLDLLMENQVEAIICVGSTYEEEDFYTYLLEAAKSIPIAMLDANPNEKSDNMVYVYVDEADAMSQALGHLRDKGYHYPIFVSLNEGISSRSYMAKKAGFIEALERFYPGVDYIEFSIKNINEDLPALYQFLIKNPSIDAICFELDTLAIPTFKYLTNHDIDIPNNLAIIGFDNIDATNYPSKKITSIDQMIKSQADIATKTLFKLINKEKPVENSHMIKTNLIIKETS